MSISILLFFKKVKNFMNFSRNANAAIIRSLGLGLAYPQLMRDAMLLAKSGYKVTILAFLIFIKEAFTIGQG